MSTTPVPTKAMHQWAAGGVSGYPVKHPLIGQGDFFNKFQHFLRLNTLEEFVQVFAAIAAWGVGKSSLGFQVISQINNTSRGWFVRDEAGELQEAKLFKDDAERGEYLGLYLRYSQIRNEYQNIDNWFGFGLYKALVPLATGQFDNSIHLSIARETSDRLEVKGFERAKLAAALELEKKYTDQELFENPTLVTTLCEKAYAYLQNFGIKYMLLVLDELETAGEASTYGIEEQDMKYMDGRAIKMIGAAIKEEDPRRKLPWLRYLALCSPVIGHELREIQSLARRFELMELQANAFSDVSDFVRKLDAQGRLSTTYPQGLVEAAYSMSAGNFGWFNVLMANVETKLQELGGGVSLGKLFSETARSSSRLSDHVLDTKSLDHLTLPATYKPQGAEFLYGQLPRALATWPEPVRQALSEARNEFDEPVACLFRKVIWDEAQCENALREAKFTRDGARWRCPNVSEPLNLQQLLANLGTFAIHETAGAAPSGGQHPLLIPTQQKEFVQLVQTLYPHPAAEDAARALWKSLAGGADFPDSSATHLGPSLAMLSRLNLRLRRQQQNTFVFRTPDENAAFDKAISFTKKQTEKERGLQMLTGTMRLLDENWDYQAVEAGLTTELLAIETAKEGNRKGLITLDGLKLHPDGRAIFALVKSQQELESLCDQVSAQHRRQGRTPVLAFTTSHQLVDAFNSSITPKLKTARGYLKLHQLSTNEEFMLHQIGLPKEACTGFQLNRPRFSTPFDGRLQALRRGISEAVVEWRRELNQEGRIAWPFRSSGTLKPIDRDLLIRAWRQLLIEAEPAQALADLDETSGLKVEEVKALLSRLDITSKARSSGYTSDERALLFDPLGDSAEPKFPHFLRSIANRVLKNAVTWDLDRARSEWFWGYCWEGAKPADIFKDWMALLCDMELVKESGAGENIRDKRYEPLDMTELAGFRQEADNWLAKDLGPIVSRLAGVFGEGKVMDMFAPKSHPKPGTKVNRAAQYLTEAKSLLDQTKTLEDNYDPDKMDADSQVANFRTDCRNRLKVKKMVDWVYVKDRFGDIVLGDNLKTINFENDDVPLWERIGKADKLATYFKDQRAKMTTRAESLQQILKDESKDTPGFPTAVFVRQLERIKSVLAAAEKPAGTTNLGETTNVQYTTPGTLAFLLKDLKAQQAIEKLEQLAVELGYDPATGAVKSLAETEGQIVSTFVELKALLSSMQGNLAKFNAETQANLAQLASVPPDYTYPNIPAAKTLAARADEIMEELALVQDDLEDVVNRHANPAQLGHFQPMMLDIKKTYQAKDGLIGVYRGQVTTLSNSVTGYRNKLVEDSPINQIHEALNPLRRAKNMKPWADFGPNDIETDKAPTLKDAVDLVAQLVQAREADGTALLVESGISFARWKVIYAAISTDEDPGLSAEEEKALLDGGFLRKKLVVCS
jgi:hypothetical protein